MAKASPVKNSAAFVTFEGTITRNGVTQELRSVNYRRIEREDGTVEERGRPDGLQPGASLGEIMAAALAPAPPSPPRPRKRVKSRQIKRKGNA